MKGPWFFRSVSIKAITKFRSLRTLKHAVYFKSLTYHDISKWPVIWQITITNTTPFAKH